MSGGRQFHVRISLDTESSGDNQVFYVEAPPPPPRPAALLEGSEGFDLSRGTWRRSGWRELDALRQVRFYLCG